MKLLDKARNKTHRIIAKFSPPPVDLVRRCLDVDEILRGIVVHAYDSVNGRPSVAALALTCKAFNGIATAYLWSDLPSITPLVTLYSMMYEEWAKRERVIPIHFITSHDLLESAILLRGSRYPACIMQQARWKTHANSVKRLRWNQPQMNFFTVYVIQEHADIIRSGQPPLLPNLEYIHFADGRPACLQLLRYLIGPATKTVTMDASDILLHRSDDEHVQDYNLALVDALSSTLRVGSPVKSFSLYVDPLFNIHADSDEDDYRYQRLTSYSPFYPPLDVQGYFDLHMSQCQGLTHLSLSVPLSDQTIFALSVMPNLLSLHLVCDSTEQPIQQSISTDLGSSKAFPSLESLHLIFSGDVDDILPFVLSVRAPVLQKLVVQFFEGFSPSESVFMGLLRYLTHAPFYDTLKSLSLKVAPAGCDGNKQLILEPLTQNILAPLLERPFPQLTHLCVLHSQVVADDYLINDIGRRYPFLQEFQLCRPVGMGFLSPSFDSRVTYDGLHTLLSSCPALHTLWLAIDTTRPPQFTAGPYGRLRRWCVVDAKVSENDRDLVRIATALYVAFPGLERVWPADHALMRCSATLNSIKWHRINDIMQNKRRRSR